MCVKLLYVKFVCVCVEVAAGGGRRRRSPGYRIKNKNPTQSCGELSPVSPCTIACFPFKSLYFDDLGLRRKIEFHGKTFQIAKRETNAREVGEGPSKDKLGNTVRTKQNAALHAERKHRDWRRDCLCAEAYVFSIPNVYVFYKQVIEWGRVVQV